MNFNFLITNTIKLIIQFIFLFSFTISNGQEGFIDKDISSSYEGYTELPRELAYSHLNKSIYIKGEDIGFSTYVLDKVDKQLSVLTTNLYCVITDKDNKVIKKKLFKVSKGVASGAFSVDSLFTSGEYTFKAYTNWMQNFKEQNFYVQTIRIIDPDIESFVKPQVTEAKVDAQFLPEGGHLVANIKNVMGVVIKDGLGYGIPYIKGKLLNSLNETIAIFKVDKLGVGRFSFTPNKGESYQVEINYNDKLFLFKIKNIESRGIIFSLKQQANKVAISLKTNKETLPLLKNKNYKLVVHDGNESKIIAVSFNDSLEVQKLFDSKKLFSGINIFTFFDDNNSPLLERLFFNYEGVNFIKSDNLSVKKDLDSLEIKLSYKDIDLTKYNNLSISILPGDTRSYHHHHNIASYTLLQPYVKNPIENAQYYFTQIDRKKKYELDNLLLTQGWSSYDWNMIFNYPPSSYYAFEYGIGFIANVSKAKLTKLVLYPIGDGGFNFFNLNENERSFQKGGLFPIEDEEIKFAEIQSGGSLKPPSLYLQFFPSIIPDFKLTYSSLNIKRPSILQEVQTESFSSLDLDKTQELEVVTLKGKVEQTRIEKIKEITPYSKVDAFNDIKRGKHETFTEYLRRKGYKVFDEQGNFVVLNSGARSFLLNTGPIIYIDGAQVLDLSSLSNYDMEWVDYVEINRNGIGEGIRGGGGVIKIFTIPMSKRREIRNFKSLAKYKIPLTFSAPKKFYIPKYAFYNTDFFNKYGVIDWLPINRINENGNSIFKIDFKKTTSLKLFIQGIANDGSFISEVRTVNY